MLLGVLGVAYLGHLQFQTPWIPGYDGYYHIKFAQLLPSIGFSGEFPWAEQSLWARSFADKEFLFHVLVSPLPPATSGRGSLRYNV